MLMNFLKQVWLLIAISIPITVLIMSCLSWVKLPNAHSKIRKSSNEKLILKRETFTQYAGTYTLYTVNIFTNHGDAQIKFDHYSYC